MTEPFFDVTGALWRERQAEFDRAAADAKSVHGSGEEWPAEGLPVEAHGKAWVIDEPWSPYMVEALVTATPRGPRCIDLHIVARGEGEAITPAGLRRVPLGRIIRLIEGSLPARLTVDKEGRVVPVAEDRQARAAYRRAVTRRRNEGARWRLDADTLAKVADVYRSALASGASPTAAVEDYFRLGNRAQAARWVKRAREEGHLGAAPGRRLKGEQQ